MLDSPRIALVAEDNAALRRVIAHTLRGRGFDVVDAPDGQAAWEVAQRQTFDLVVTDQQMPRMTGLELVERLRGSDGNALTPVVLLTAKGLELEAERVRDAYAVAAMMHKPFSPAQLASLAESLVGQPV